VALMDEGCGKEEDVGAMMSIADGVVKMEMEEDRQLLNIVKHPRARPARIQVPIEPEPTFKSTWHFDPSVLRQFTHSMMGGDEALAFRREVGDFVSLPWPNLAHWSGMLWDPKRFPTMIYQLNKEDQEGSEELGLEELIQFMPWRMKLLWRALLSSQALGLLPRNFSKVRDMKRMSKVGVPYISGAQMERCGTIEYLDDVSKTDEHYFRVYESSDCWGFENVGSPMASHLPPGIAGQLKCFENDERDWNAIEIKCVGLGDPYCEFKVAPGEIDELRNSLEKDSSVIEKVHERLMDRLMAFLLKGKPLVQRPRLGSDVHLHVAMHAMGFAHVAGNRYTMAQRMGGARSGKEVGMRLIEAGIASDEAIDRAINFMNHAKVGKVTLGETIRIRENCESIRSKLFTAIEGPSCFFTTGFLNGLFSAVKNQHVREIRCIAAGDAHCEWEIIS
jgi:predicted hydrocarbon binding protein